MSGFRRGDILYFLNFICSNQKNCRVFHKDLLFQRFQNSNCEDVKKGVAFSCSAFSLFLSTLNSFVCHSKAMPSADFVLA